MAGIGVYRSGARRGVAFLQALDRSVPGGEAGGKKVRPAVIVIVHEKTDETIVLGLNDAGLLRDLREVPVAVVVVEAIRRTALAVEEDVEAPVLVVVAER